MARRLRELVYVFGPKFSNVSRRLTFGYRARISTFDGIANPTEFALRRCDNSIYLKKLVFTEIKRRSKESKCTYNITVYVLTESRREKLAITSKHACGRTLISSERFASCESIDLRLVVVTYVTRKMIEAISARSFSFVVR